MTEETQQEEVLGKAYDLRLVRRLWYFIIPYKRLFYLSLALLPLQQAFGLAQPYLMKIGIDQYIAGKNLLGLQTVMLCFLAALIGETVAVLVRLPVRVELIATVNWKLAVPPGSKRPAV